jgi:hypothetical protein
MRRFTSAEFVYTRMYFVYGFCDGNSLAALKEYQHLNLDRRQPCWCVLQRWIVFWGKQALSCRMNVLAVEAAICGPKRMWWITDTITHQQALVRFLLHQDILRERYVILWVRISSVSFPFTTSKTVAARVKTSPSPVFTMGATQDCGYSSISVPCIFCTCYWLSLWINLLYHWSYYHEYIFDLGI